MPSGHQVLEPVISGAELKVDTFFISAGAWRYPS
jgi:hypothetical protein